MTPEEYRIAELDDEVCMGHLENVQRLLEAGAAVNGRNRGGHTPLMAAPHTGQPEMVRLLLRFGADAALTNNDPAFSYGETAPQLARNLAHDTGDHAEVLAVFEEQGIV